MAESQDVNKLGAYHISSDIQNYEVARSSFFTLIIEGLDELVYPEYSYTGSNVASEYVTGTSAKYGSKRSASEIIKLSVTKASIPHFKVDTVDIKRGNSQVRFAGAVSWDGETSIDCDDFVGLETKNVLMAWQNLVYQVTDDTLGRAGDWTDEVNGEVITRKGYKHNATLCEYTPDFKLIRYWTIIGCFPLSLSESNLEKSNSSGRSISMTLAYDRAIPHNPDDAK